jgi:hypothetical protein
MGMRRSGTLCAVLLVVVLGVIAAPAWAGNGHGNGNANGNGNGNGKPDDPAAAQTAPSDPAATPGNSGNAPGQDKKDAQDPKPEHGNTSSGSTSTAAQPTAGPTEGVKPSNSTAHNTNAQAGSNSTKKYGNGKTAGQIAIQSGYPSSGNLYGPGNSQPHKATCGGRHAVDVHALKSHRANGCGTPERPPTHVPDPPKTSEPPVVVVTPHDPTGSPSLPPSEPAHDPAKQSAGSAAGNVGGQTMSGVLAVATAGHATLPFTGFPVWAAVLAAIVLVAAGLTLRRLARACG